ncbi:MAG: hypothetical protein JSR99_01940 [Proteobacteria bacterium]|nr:hypothetical protein [Pseudomonadota bacterium]
MDNETCDLPKPTAPVALSDKVWIGPAPKPGMLQLLFENGFRSIINNQPDSDDGLLMLGSEVAAEAGAVGLSYLHIPVEGRNPLEKDVRRFGHALETLPGPIFAYCRTGGRSASLWAMASVHLNDTEALIAQCRQIGFDISGLRAKMDMRREMLAEGDLDD